NVRVHELAKELGATSKEVLARLNADGENVKSASSRISAGTALRMRESFKTTPPTIRRNTLAPSTQPQAASKSPAPPNTVSEEQRPKSILLNSDNARYIYRRYRTAAAAEDPDHAVEELARECEARFGIERKLFNSVVTSDNLRRKVAEEERLESLKAAAAQQKRANKNSVTAPRKTPTDTASSPQPRDGAAAGRPRHRTGHLPPLGATMDIHAAAEIVHAKAASPDQATILACLQELAPDGDGRYGYLTWRYASTRAVRAESGLTPGHEDLIALATVIDNERRLVDTLVRAHGRILTKPNLAAAGLDKEFRKLTSSHGKGRTDADEVRRARAAFDFLRCALILTIASADHGHRLWNILGSLPRPKDSDLTTGSPQLQRARRRLAELTTAVERLLSTDKADLAKFFLHSRAHLVALQLKRYDFLRPFRDSAAAFVAPKPRINSHLAFEILPQGEQLRTFLGEIRTSKKYRGYTVDERRLTVLEDLQNHFGAANCTWHRGIEAGGGIGTRYLVLAVNRPGREGQDAVAVSPLAGRHATYVVRRDCVEADWEVLFAHPKFEARLRGARKLLFTSRADDGDPYRAMLAKVIKLLECPAREFRAATDSYRQSHKAASPKPARAAKAISRRKVRYQLLLDSVAQQIREQKTAGVPNDIIAQSIWASLDERQQETLMADLRSTEYGRHSDPLESLHRFVQAQKVPRPPKR
ncbi:MAG: hypothetical protein FGM52_10295, partial [Mycobacterium sp.]|nr:hypothetical protein [Mycobacterium sp.]